MQRNQQVIRVLQILHKLLTQQMGVTLRELAQQFKIHPKTARRDIKALEESPFALISSQIDNERIYTIDGPLSPKQTSSYGTTEVPSLKNEKKS